MGTIQECATLASMNQKDIVISIPHAGTFIPDDIRKRIPHSDHAICNESDLYTDQIYALPDIPTVIAKYSRIIADPNRAPDELYTEGVLRALGAVMLSLPEGTDTFKEDPTIEEMTEWMMKFHAPYHRELFHKATTAQFLIDCHSMWSRAAPGHYGTQGDERADIILGNLYFCTCSAETTNFFAAFFAEKGYSVSINDPYPGRYVLGTYCSRIGLPGIQIEINRKLYMNEQTLDPNDTAITHLNFEFAELVSSFCQWYQGPQDTEDKELVDLSENFEV